MAGGGGWCSRNRRSILIAVLVVILVVVAFVVGYFVRRAPKCSEDAGSTEKSDAALSDAVKDISASQIKKQLRYFAGIPHIAGTNESYEQAKYMQNLWKDYGLDRAELERYSILLSYPTRPGVAALLDKDGKVLHASAPREKILEPSENDTRRVFSYNAYSGSGAFTGKLVYANYGRVEDFEELEKMGINVSGKVVIARYGKLFRGSKALNAENRGAKALIIYTDPADYAKEGVNKTYPDYNWISSDGVQRGNLWMVKGDPLTPGYPATDGIYRISEKDVPFRKIPVQPISFGDAEPLLRALSKSEAPLEWQGGLGFKYHLEMADSEDRTVNVNVSLSLERRDVYNVIGTIYGQTEPDRYVILGNHRDAWGFGAADPSSGTAVMMELSRALGKARKGGWRPRRTIKFASWGAEEFGIMGSGEWVEEYEKILGSRAVAYLNVDIAVLGKYVFRAKSSPLLDMAVFDATKEVSVPKTSDSVYKQWKTRDPDSSKENPKVSTVGGGSDFLFFLQTIGVPCVDLRYMYDSKKSGYPLYHTLHETVHWMEELVDPDYAYHKAMAQVSLQLLLAISEPALLPFDIQRYAKALEDYGNALKKSLEVTLKNQNISLDFVMTAITRFKEAAGQFKGYLDELDKDNALQVRMANDRLMQVERAFINTEGLPDRPAMRHLIFAPGMFNLYAGSKFPGITDSVYLANQTNDWEQVKKQVSMVLHAVRSAITVLKPVNM